MLNIQLLCIGKLKEDYLRMAAAEYQKRLGAFCRLTVTELPPARLPETPSPAQIEAALAEEGKRILALLSPRTEVIALCIEGKLLSSEVPCGRRRVRGRLRDRRLLRPCPCGQAAGTAAPVHEPDDLSASARPRDAARTGLPRVHDRRRREISQMILRHFRADSPFAAGNFVHITKSFPFLKKRVAYSRESV